MAEDIVKYYTDRLNALVAADDCKRACLKETFFEDLEEIRFILSINEIKRDPVAMIRILELAVKFQEIEHECDEGCRREFDDDLKK